jgi:flagellar biosynthetic protein FliR
VDLKVQTAQLIAVMLASVRVAAWLVVSPPFTGRTIPATIKALLSVAIALPVAPRLVDSVPDLNSPDLIVSVIQQAIIGLTLGFLTSLLFMAVQSAGNLVDLFGGFSVAYAVDPFAFSGNGGTAVFGRFYNLIATTLLFATGGHQLMLRGFTVSFEALPANTSISWQTLASIATTGLGQMFVAAIQLAGPLIAVLFCTDVALGLLNRVAPAMNVFSLGFPVKILLTLTAGTLAVGLIPTALENIVDTTVRAMVAAVGR